MFNFRFVSGPFEKDIILMAFSLS